MIHKWTIFIHFHPFSSLISEKKSHLETLSTAPQLSGPTPKGPNGPRAPRAWGQLQNDVLPCFQAASSLLGAADFPQKPLRVEEIGLKSSLMETYGGFQLVMGVPLYRWLVYFRENPIVRNGWLGGSLFQETTIDGSFLWFNRNHPFVTTKQCNKSILRKGAHHPILGRWRSSVPLFLRYKAHVECDDHPPIWVSHPTFATHME